MTDPLNLLRLALSNLSGSAATLNSYLHEATDALAAVDLTPPRPALHVIKADTSGQTDATADIQAGLDSGAGIVFLPPGVYARDAAKGLFVRSRTLFIMDSRAILSVRPNGLPRYDCLSIEDASDVAVIGGKMFGDRTSHNYVDTGSSTRTHEWGVGLRIRRARNVYVNDLAAAEFTGDGVCASGENIELIGVVCESNRRQGMSIFEGRNYIIRGGEYKFTGNLSGQPGTMPMAGVDIEPDNGLVENVLFDGVTFRGNTTSGLLLWTRANTGAAIRGVVARGCTFGANANGVHAQGLGGEIELAVTRSLFDRNRKAGARVEQGTNVTIGTSDKADANEFKAVVSRSASEGEGLLTRWDIQRYDDPALSKLSVGWNRYT